MFKQLGVVVAITFSLLFAHLGQAAAAAPEKKMTAEEFVTSLKFQQGKITLPNGIAKLNLSPSFRYLSPEDIEKVLVDAWGNPPGAKTLGMIFPANLRAC